MSLEAVEAKLLLRHGQSYNADFNILALGEYRIAAGDDGCTCGEDIIYEQNVAAGELLGSSYTKDSIDIFPTFVALVVSLALVVYQACEGVVRHLRSEHRSYAVSDVIRLIITAMDSLAEVERHGDNKVNIFVISTPFEDVAKPSAQLAGIGPAAVIFEVVNNLAPIALGHEKEEGRGVLYRHLSRESLDHRIALHLGKSGHRDSEATLRTYSLLAIGKRFATDGTFAREEQSHHIREYFTKHRHCRWLQSCGIRVCGQPPLTQREGFFERGQMRLRSRS